MKKLLTRAAFGIGIAGIAATGTVEIPKMNDVYVKVGPEIIKFDNPAEFEDVKFRTKVMAKGQEEVVEGVMSVKVDTYEDALFLRGIVMAHTERLKKCGKTQFDNFNSAETSMEVFLLEQSCN